MSPGMDEEVLWLGGSAGKAKPPAGRHGPGVLSREVIGAYVAKVRRLRWAAMAGYVRDASRVIGRWFGRARGPRRGASTAAGAQAELAFAPWLISPVTSIRSSSEVLRDDPDMPLEDRKRFLNIIVQESERLSAAIDQIRGGTTPNPAPTRQIRSAGS